MSLWLIPLDYSLPNIRSLLDARGDRPLDPAEVQAAAETLKRCVETGERLVRFAVGVAGFPSPL